jgi:hypothetical protein
MWIRRNHERRYYRHGGEWFLGMGHDNNNHFYAHLTTPRHRFNWSLRRGRKIVVVPSGIFDDAD